MRQFDTTNSEMLCNHGEIIVPGPEIRHIFLVVGTKSERSNVICKAMLWKDLTGHLCRLILHVNHSNYHALQNLVRLTTMCVRWGDHSLCYSIVAIVKFGDVATKIFVDCKLTTWVDPLVTINTQY